MKMIAPWVIFAVVGFLGYFFVNLLLKVVAKENPLLISLILYGTAAVTMLIILLFKGDFTISLNSAMIAVVIGICSVAATVFAIKSINLAPNPGYSVAIYSSNFVLLTIFSVFLFHSSLTLTKILGIVATFIGLILLSI